MITYKEDDASKTIELKVTGKVTKDDFNKVAGKMDAFIAKHGKVKLLKDVSEYSGVELSTVFSGLAFAKNHIKNITHAAYITDSKLLDAAAKAEMAVAGLFIDTQVKGFTSDKVDDARAWLKNPKP